MSKLFQRYGSVASMATGGRVRLFSSLPVPGEVVFVRGPELLRYVSTQHSIYHRRQLLGPLTVQGEPTERQRALRYWGAGLFDINEQAHRRARRLMLPAFHKRRVESYRDEMVALTQAMLDGWVVDARRDVHADLIDLTMRIVTSTLFGVDPHRVGAQIGHAIQESFEVGFNPVTVLVQIDRPGFSYRRFLDLVNQTNATMRQIIATKRAQGDGGDVLSMLLAARDEDGSQLSEDELLAHATLLFMAGHETSSSALAWTLFLLGQHPAIAADLLDELSATLGGAPPSVEQLRPDSNCLPLLDRVVKESMRILPAVAWNARVAAQDDVLGGYAIPANTEVLMSIYHTHHAPELYPLPERFDPRRWEGRDYGVYEYRVDGNQTGARHDPAALPFGAGAGRTDRPAGHGDDGAAWPAGGGAPPGPSLRARGRRCARQRARDG
jgi:cytochrome P450